MRRLPTGWEWRKFEANSRILPSAFLDPAAYQNTVAQIEARRAVNLDFIQEAERIIAKELAEHNIPARLESRIKRIYGVYTKMKRQKIGIDEVFDFVAIRVITDTVRTAIRFWAFFTISGNRFRDASRTILPYRVRTYTSRCIRP